MTTEHIIETAGITLLALLGAAAFTTNTAPATSPQDAARVELPGSSPTPADAEAEPDAPAAVAPAAGVFETPIPPAPVVGGPTHSAAGVKTQSADCATCAPAARYTQFSQPVGPLRRIFGRRR